MAENFRQSEILDIARRKGRVSVEKLARRFQTSAQTIRKDLSDLSDNGHLKRVHGGAILPENASVIGYEDRRKLNHTAKTRIAKACADDIPEGACVFLNIGTTTEAVARELLNHTALMVVTNNLNVANILSASPQIDVMVAGGTLRRSDGGLVGAMTTKLIAQFKFDYAVIGCSALDNDGDILDFDIQEVDVSQTIIARSRNTFLVSDTSKLQRTAPVKIASLENIDRFYTDAPLPRSLGQSCTAWGTELVQC
ncbi:transcriptional regulator, DeoR family [Litoreibacter ascidiaceicola]|uniref:Transcriptional regulator, DeoR family n=1 Tax=Litoreibacter ascidiaceicola TaxID=1486859 RepID=A0A1M5CF57_9RHOB|nr:DeoR/GlpR family DNA-binding transcription regulator [Litoreibacter ascidiaceicola]SHF53404.1 transcriptional regulator, DeoR family [Litoreibacter ascidiaceicola]